MPRKKATPKVSSISAQMAGRMCHDLIGLGFGSQQAQETVIKKPHLVAALLHAIIAQPDLMQQLSVAVWSAPDQVGKMLSELPYDRYGPFLLEMRGLRVDPASPDPAVDAAFNPKVLSSKHLYNGALYELGEYLLSIQSKQSVQMHGQHHLWWALNHPDLVPRSWFSYTIGMGSVRPCLVFPGTVLIGPDDERSVPCLVAYPEMTWITLDLNSPWSWIGMLVPPQQ